MKKQILILLFFSSLFSAAQNPLVKMWDYRYGGTEQDLLEEFHQTSDGGFILAGNSISGVGGDITNPSQGSTDFWIIKLDVLGNKQWDKRYGGLNEDDCYSLQQTSDGGYLFGGRTYSDSTGDMSQHTRGFIDCWILKTDSLGNKQWDKRYGGSDADELISLQQTDDGGFILGCISKSPASGDKSEPNRDTSYLSIDYWIIKIDSVGNIQWDKTFGGNDNDYLNAITQTSDGGYILGGYTYSDSSGNISQATFGGYDYWIVKINSIGDIVWEKRYGGLGWEGLFAMTETNNNDLILCGNTSSDSSGDVSQITRGNADYWILKINSAGIKQWDKRFGGDNYEYLYSCEQTNDGGFLLGGISQSNASGDKSENNLGYGQGWVVKVDSIGNMQWDKTLFTLREDLNTKAVQSHDGCYVFAENTDADTGGYKTQFNWGDLDYWIIKFCDSTLTTNIANTEKTNDQLQLWPNPTSAEFKIQNAELNISKIEIFNAIGERLYYESTICASCIVHCESFPPGIYFVKVVSDDKFFFEKIIKQ